MPPDKLLKTLLDRYFSTQIYRCLCESVAAEHGARMVAMENATKNAGEMISNLTLTYNKLRQSAITTELTEIVAGVEASKIKKEVFLMNKGQIKQVMGPVVDVEFPEGLPPIIRL